MNSESEIRWYRAKNNVGTRTVTTAWHAIIGGIGSIDVPPGTVCGVGLTGSLTSVDHAAIRTVGGHQHERCVELVDAWLAELDNTPGPIQPPDPEVTYALPGSSSE
jgi:hypothetical protein